MSASLDEVFDEVHRLLASKKAARAVVKLVNASTGRLHKKFAADRNHAWYCVGCAEYLRGRYPAALKAYRHASRADLSDVQALLAVANCYNELRRPKLAERSLRRALDQDPDGQDAASVHYNLGNALFDQGHFQEALTQYSFVSLRRDSIGTMARKNAKLAKARMTKSRK